MRQELLETRKAAFAPSTQKNLVTQWKSYTKFTESLGKPYYPTSIDILCLYAQYLSHNLRSAASIRNYVSGALTCIVLKGGSIPNLNCPEFKLTIKGLTKILKHTPKQATPITPEMLIKFSKLINMTDSFQVALWAAIIVGFFLLLRKSNLVPDSVGKFDSQKQLSGSNVKLSDNAALVTLSWTKTIQAGERKVKIPMLHIPGSPISPVTVLKAVKEVNGIEANSPLFRYKRQDAWVPLTYRQLNQGLKRLAQEIGMNPNRFSSHSLRHGGATYAYKVGVAPVAIQRMGDWKSDAYLSYIQDQLDTRIRAVSKVKASLIL